MATFDVPVAWNAINDPTITGYNIYAGDQTTVYNDPASPKHVGNVLNTIYTFATPGRKFIAIKGVNPQGESLTFSNEIQVNVVGPMPSSRPFMS